MKFFGIKHEINQIKITLCDYNFYIKYDSFQKAHKNYTKKLKSLRKKYSKEPIKIGFLINEPAKWQYESLYNAFAAHPNFDPIILVSKLLLPPKVNIFYKSIEECYNFYRTKNYKVKYAYDRKRHSYLSPKAMNVDILFYQQPWYLSDKQAPLAVMSKALTCYVPYGLHLVEYNGSYTQTFHKLLWQMFVEDQSQVERFSKLMKMPINNCSVVGYPKLDAYFTVSDKSLKVSNKPLLIYAPHHSFEPQSLGCATFQHNGKHILKLAQKYKQEIDWIFKPHPRFKSAVINNNIMSEEETDQYYKSWEEIGTIYDSGDYIDLFKYSAGMITDSISFLGEYLPSKHPLFHLIAEKFPFNDFAKSFIDSYYQIHNMTELETHIKNVILQHQDTKKEQRLSKIKILFDEHEKSADKILNILIKNLKG